MLKDASLSGGGLRGAQSVRPAIVAGAPTIQELVVRAMGDDDAAWAVLNQRLGGVFTRFWRERFADDTALAEDLAHQTVSESLQALASGRYDPDRADFLTFAYAVGRRIELRHLDARTRRREVQLPEPLEGQAPGTIVLADEADVAERIEDVLGCLRAEGTRNSLTPEERYVLVSLVNGRTLAELTRQLGCSLDTVHRRKTRALEKLGRCMASCMTDNRGPGEN